ncbi:TldD/PmbA family protein [Candidatus Saganbacteria bacterium]|nr:TldD/PmbA family protein [Candidatus Saganbacteria bacterium]
MLSKQQLEEILQEALKTGAEFAEIFLEEKNSTSVGLEDNRLEKIILGTEAGCGIRVMLGRETGYACTTDLSFFGLKQAALSAASGINGSINLKLPPLVPQIPALPAVKRRPHEVPIEEKVQVVEILNKTARSFGEKIKQVSARYSDTTQALTIVNSDGIYVEDQRFSTRYYVNVIASDGVTLQTGYEAPGGSVGFELIEEHPPEKMASKAAERALLMLTARHAPSGQMPVILSSSAGGTMIHEACGHSLEADFILKGTSVFTGKLGQKVAAELVTVVDDPSLPGKFGSYNFDDEGTPSKTNILIENGILKNYLSDRYNSKALGLLSSGHGRRESFRTKPVPRMANTLIAPGKTSPDDIISSIKSGLLVKRMGGGEVNVTNGDFVFEVTEGYLIENGKISHPVRGAVLTGNGPKVLEIIDLVGTDLEFQVGVCGKYDHVPVADAQPTLRIPGLVVGGR